MSDINFGAITEALNDKVDLPTPSIPQDNVDYVIESGKDENGIRYRVWKSGWLELYGSLETAASGTLTFPKPYAEVPHVSFMAVTTRTAVSYDSELYPNTVTETYFTYTNAAAGYTGAKVYWKAEGQGAE